MEQEQIEQIVEWQGILENYPELCDVKGEMTIIGYYLNGTIPKVIPKSHTFTTELTKAFLEEIEKSKFKISQDELRNPNLLGWNRTLELDYLDSVLEASKSLAKGITEEEYIEIKDKICRLYDIREIFNKIYNKFQDEYQQENFELRVSTFAKSERMDLLSLEQIKNIATSYCKLDFNNIVSKSNTVLSNLTSFLENKTKEQDKGILLPFTLVDKAINGLRKGQLLATGMMSNDGKTRLMVRVVANLSIIQNKKVLIISNEMTEEDIRYAFITTIINNAEFKDMQKDIIITKTEREIRNGIYATEDEQQQVKQITSYIEEKFSNNVIVIHTTQYTAKDLKDIILTHYLENSIDYFFYDTLKADIDTMSNWDGLKATGTVLSELAKEYNICIWANIQLVNSPQPIQASVDNIANSKQLYHILDTLLVFVPIPKSDYADFRYWASSSNPSNDNIQKLDTSKKYYACTILKNRIGAKPNLLFEVDLDQNTWEEIGQLARYKDVKRFLE